MKKLIVLLTGLFIFINSNAQTNVSGGIYSNTTWTIAGSPYIITDTLVLFSGKTLTIQPGVVVKFDNTAYLEIRGNIFANGNPGDTILFTSNASTPYMGIYPGILCNGDSAIFSYCSFSYAKQALFLEGTGILPVTHCLFTSDMEGCFAPFIDRCTFKYDSTGVVASLGGEIQWCTFLHDTTGIYANGFDSVLNCTFRSNAYGMLGSNGDIVNCIFDSNRIGALYYSGNYVSNCTIKYNGEGINRGPRTIQYCDISHNTKAIDNVSSCKIEYNNISYNGVGINSSGSTIEFNTISNNSIGIKSNSDIVISCNSICNNTQYSIEAEMVSNESAANNYWCLPDSVQIQATIYDAYQDINLGFVFFTPFDTLPCPNVYTGINELPTSSEEIKLFPNPNNGSFTIQSSVVSGHPDSYRESVEIYNVMGEKVYSEPVIRNSQFVIDLSAQPNGIYFYRVLKEDGGLIGEGKIIVSK